MTSPIGSVLDDPNRVLTLRDSGLMDTPPEDSFDRVTRLTCKMVRAPAAMISLLDVDRQFIKSGIGLGEPWAPGRSVPVTQSFCRHVVESGQPFLVADARRDEQVGPTPPVRGLSMIAYAGFPVRVTGGHVLGSLCAIDYMPRSWVAEEVELLAELAAVVAQEIGLRIDGRRALQSAGVAANRADYFRSLVESAWDVIYVMDAGGVIREVGRASQRVLGYAPHEVVGKRESELVHPEDLARIDEAFEQDIRSPLASPPHDIRLRRRDGSWCTVEATRKLLTDGSGAPVAVVNARDVTERRRAEGALRRSEERFQLAARATNDVIWEWSLECGELHWCEDAHKTFRFAPAEMGAAIEWWYDRIHPEDRERVISGVQQVLSGVGEFWSGEYRIRRGDGSYATVLDRALVARDERGAPVRVIGSMVDVTERRRAEDAQRFLARASATLDRSLDCDAMLASLARVIVPSLADVCLVHVLQENGMLRRAAGADARPGREGAILAGDIVPPDADAKRHPVLKAVATGHSVLVRKCTDNLLKAFARDPADLKRLKDLGLCSLIAVPMVSHDRVLGVITLGTTESARHYGAVDLVVAEDLARRAAVALENCLLYAKSEQAVRARDAVLGVVSHDLRNPLNTIHMAASLLLEGSEERRAENVTGLEVIKRSVHQMNAMIKDLLDASSIDAGQFRVAQARRDVGSLLREIGDLVHPLATAKGVTLVFETATELSTVWADTNQIQRVFSNLIGNAIKFTPAGGEIRVHAARSDEEVVFSVSDTGPGIPSEQLPHVFDRYWQGARGDRRGAGLGLAIAKGIVEAHGGRIWVESVAGNGSTFRFTVPVVDGQAGTTPGVQVAA
ncbi:MAG: PAS domain-containing protein [Gemmatimonadaceae bacterium]